jgi:hypothetical protein
VDTPTCHTKKLANTPPELAGNQPAAPAAPRGPTAGTPPGRPMCAGGAHLAPRSREQGCALHRASGRGAHRAGPWAAARAGVGRPQGVAAKWRRARSAICGSRSEPRRLPALQPRANTCTWHWEKQSPAPGARRRAPRSATPPGPFLQTAKSQNFTFIDPT